MADKRMFSKVITMQDEFLDMPLSAQALYFHLNMQADDEGFVSNVKSLMRQVRACEDDLKILIAKRYILTFESGVMVIKHWLIHNTIRQDRIQETTYKEEKSKISVKENGSYTDKPILIEEKSEEKGMSDTMSDTCPPNLIYTNMFISIIDYLNKRLNTRYRYNNTRTNAYIKARLNEGYTVEDFYKVIDTKYNDWFGTEYAKYLTPETLFRPSNFEKYLNQKPTNSTSKNVSKAQMEELQEIARAKTSKMFGGIKK